MDYSPPGSSVHGISRQECWSGLPFPSPGDCPDPGIKPGSPALQADSLPSEPPGKLYYRLCILILSGNTYHKYFFQVCHLSFLIKLIFFYKKTFTFKKLNQ
ncbi:unnamed protein product [Rangifer tarandus platyrhynchus]|uniref:Uncharacterized protein n=2 Tax=Rangifer tarandus platyrhynchus TaxID=3082113 RepID=A0ABN8ZKK9_RANTA|nr:unnamed protein product [Rangifer tarandus platyrhynchus]